MCVYIYVRFSILIRQQKLPEHLAAVTEIARYDIAIYYLKYKGHFNYRVKNFTFDKNK